MSRLQDWIRACSSTESATSLALFRIAIGLCTLLTIGSVVAVGLDDVLWVHSDHGGMRALNDPPWLIAILGGATPAVIRALCAVAMLAASMMTIGIGGRPMALITAVVVNNLVDVNGHAGGSYDELLCNALWLVFLAGGHRTLSLEARLRTGQWWPRVDVLVFPRWLAIWQLCLMYGTTGLQKVSTYWVPGGESSALYYILQQPTWHRSEMTWIAPYFRITQVATTVTWLWEVSAFFWILFIWYAQTADRPGRLRAISNRLHLRLVYAVIGIGMHIAILATMEVGPFSPLSLSFYVLLATPEEWESLLRRKP